MAAVRDVALGKIHPGFQRQVVLGDTAEFARRHYGVIPRMRHLVLLSPHRARLLPLPHFASEFACAYNITARLGCPMRTHGARTRRRKEVTNAGEAVAAWRCTHPSRG